MGKVSLMVIIVVMAVTAAALNVVQEWKLNSDSNIKWSDKCDFVGITNYDKIIEITSQEKCQEICLADERCSHFTHEKTLGGICSLKTSKEDLKEKGSANPNNTCGYVIHRVFEKY